MNGSLKAGRYAGIDVYVHFTFFLLLAFIGGSAYLQTPDPVNALANVLLVLAIFLCVVLHEYGHALTARRYGIQTRDITLYPIGGIARLESIPTNPWQELAIALAGPAVNVVIGAALYLVLSLGGWWVSGARLDSPHVGFLQAVAKLNLYLAAFNLLPAFPMDGGRVLRALLATRFDYVRATRAAASLGQAIALMAGILALLNQMPFYVLLAVFVWFGAAQEAQAVVFKHTLHHLRVRDALQTEFHTVHPDTTLGEVVRLVMAGSQEDFPVVQEGRLDGMLPRRLLLQGLHDRGTDARVFQVMQQQVLPVRPEEHLEDVFQSQRIGGEIHSLPVMEDGRLLGLLTLQNISELLLIRNALKKA
jgi:Zn-dependent protease/CBS domain-containing protein